jgi:pantothenate synthetase
MDLTQLTAAKQQLVNDAIAAGFTAKHHAGHVDLIRCSQHKKPQVLVGLRIWANGTAFDAKLDLSVAKSIRNVDDMRAFLNLAPIETPLQRLIRTVEETFKAGHDRACVETGRYKSFSVAGVRALARRGYRFERVRPDSSSYYVYPKAS